MGKEGKQAEVKRESEKRRGQQEREDGMYVQRQMDISREGYASSPHS